MRDASDMELVLDYVRLNSETAFTGLVQRHINLVYSVALRHAGLAAHAEEITQAVFIILAHKAASLRPDTILEGWLFETTRLTALSYLRGERRRQFREQEAYMQSTCEESHNGPVWRQLAPLLDEAMSRLGKKDRDALVLRFFKDKSLQEVAMTMQMSEAAAQRRVSRALEKLRKVFTKRGVNSTTAILAGTISANSVQAAPVGLAKTISAVAIAKGATASASTLTLIKGTLKIMAWTKTKTVIAVSAGILLAAGTTTFVLSEMQGPERAQAKADIPVNLKINWQAAKKYQFHVQIFDTTTVAPTRPDWPETEIKLDQPFSVRPLDNFNNGGGQLELRFEDMVLNMSQAGREIASFDSSQNPAQDKGNPASVLRAIIGVPLTYQMDNNGKVVRVDGASEFQKQVATNTDPQAKSLLEQMVNDFSLRRFASLDDVLPGHVLKKSESWPLKGNVVGTLAGFVPMDMNYRFLDWETNNDRKCVKIEVQGKTFAGTQPTPRGAVEIMKGKVSGYVWFDPALEMIAAAKINQDMTVRMIVGGQPLLMELVQNDNLSLVGVTDAK